MAPHENLFFVEKHYNDSLYRGQRKGTTHTDREIQAAANLLCQCGMIIVTICNGIECFTDDVEFQGTSRLAEKEITAMVSQPDSYMAFSSRI